VGNSLKGLFCIRFALGCAMLVALYFCCSTPIYAQTGMTESCPSGGMPSSGTRGDGNDIQCRINNVLTSNQNLMTTLKNKLSSCTGAHCDLIKDQMRRAEAGQGRAMKANGRMKGSDYADLNTVRKEKCVGSKKDCASGNGTYTGGDADPTVGSDIADQLDSVSNALDKANATMESDGNNATPNVTAASMSQSNFIPLYDYETDPNYPTWLHSGEPNPQAMAGTTYGLLLASEAADELHDVTEDACKETVVAVGEGGNTSLACMVLTVAARTIEAEHQLFDFIDANTTGWEAHGAYVRAEDLNENLGKVDSDVAAVGVAAGNTELEISQLEGQVMQLQNSVIALKSQLSQVENNLSQKLFVSTDMNKQIMELLLVPSGNRSVPASLLTCTGDSTSSAPCPTPKVSCSTTGMCSFNGH
jgi:hypothetical protein